MSARPDRLAHGPVGGRVLALIAAGVAGVVALIVLQSSAPRPGGHFQ